MNAEAKAALIRASIILRNPNSVSRGEREQFARQFDSLRLALEADSTAMQQQIEAGADAVKGIVDNWSSGDLAQAVNTAEAWRDDVMTVFPDFEWEDAEA